MKQRLTWLALGATVVGLALPAYAMAQSGGSSRNTLDDNGVPGELRGNCDEAEHANDPACLNVSVPADVATTVTVATSISVAGEAAPLPTASTEVEVETSEPAESTPDNTVSRSAAAQSSVPGTATTIDDDDALPGGDHCLEPEHVNDPACTGAAPTASRSGGSNTTVSGNSNRGSGKGEDHSGHGSEGTSTTAPAAPAPTVTSAASQPTVTAASTDSSGSNSGKGSGGSGGSGGDDNGSGGHGSDD